MAEMMGRLDAVAAKARADAGEPPRHDWSRGDLVGIVASLYLAFIAGLLVRGDGVMLVLFSVLVGILAFAQNGSLRASVRLAYADGRLDGLSVAQAVAQGELADAEEDVRG